MSKNQLIALVCLATAFWSCSDSKDIQVIHDARILQPNVPLVAGRDNPEALEFSFTVAGETSSLELKSVELFFAEAGSGGILDAVTANLTTIAGDHTEESLFGETGTIASPLKLNGLLELGEGVHTLSFSFGVKEDAGLEQIVQVEKVVLHFGKDKKLTVEADKKHRYRLAKVIREAGQDNCDTYRIPGLVTTGNGTFVAVYDNRYNNSKDLQEDIDIGMSRSIDGGQNWEPMKVILDMGEWGGRSEQLNGIGDPCVLYDHHTHTIWVAALWMSGSAPDQMLWWASKPGLNPEETGQFILTKSTDDGLTWSEPINITEQIKDPSWQLLLQGPGRGITLDDGTLVFPAQFKADLGEKALDGGQYTSHSTIVYSTDGGKNWQIGSGAKSNTTEAQVVQLTDGSLMLNMRDDRNRQDKGDSNGRAVAITNDLGKTWTVHPSSNSALPESNCMASIISADLDTEGQTKRVLFFSNPNHKNQRTNMTIKASLDEGLTWPEEFQLELNEAAGYGYSCLTMVDEQTIGILYEGVKELYFQKVPISALLGDLIK
ncbi:sialidase family protein [Gaoshiqia sp. Z1-71]|uniref:sialidase family protein n=1 Tax=Gaoshiqia hydrogeniformans TaxID=3290090 RepID=UPI003BF7E582